MTLIASIITFSKKNILEKKNVTLDPRHGTLALDMETSTLEINGIVNVTSFWVSSWDFSPLSQLDKQIFFLVAKTVRLVMYTKEILFLCDKNYLFRNLFI